VARATRNLLRRAGDPVYLDRVQSDTGARKKGQLKILILGGDGFCGRPTSLGLSAPGHDVIIADLGKTR
jgi:hypothetical protein